MQVYPLNILLLYIQGYIVYHKTPCVEKLESIDLSFGYSSDLRCNIIQPFDLLCGALYSFYSGLGGQSGSVDHRTAVNDFLFVWLEKSLGLDSNPHSYSLNVLILTRTLLKEKGVLMKLCRIQLSIDPFRSIGMSIETHWLVIIVHFNVIFAVIHKHVISKICWTI